MVTPGVKAFPRPSLSPHKLVAVTRPVWGFKSIWYHLLPRVDDIVLLSMFHDHGINCTPDYHTMMNAVCHRDVEYCDQVMPHALAGLVSRGSNLFFATLALCVLLVAPQSPCTPGTMRSSGGTCVACPASSFCLGGINPAISCPAGMSSSILANSCIFHLWLTTS